MNTGQTPIQMTHSYLLGFRTIIICTFNKLCFNRMYLNYVNVLNDKLQLYNRRRFQRANILITSTFRMRPFIRKVIILITPFVFDNIPIIPTTFIE